MSTLHALDDSHYRAFATVSDAAMAHHRIESNDVIRAARHDVARQMAEHIVSKQMNIERDLRRCSYTYSLDVYVLTPVELANLVEERARKLVSVPVGFHHREQDHLA